MNSLDKIFRTKKPIIGMIHFMPLLGYKDYAGIDAVLNKALVDLKALNKGGVNGIMIENNYDIPHKIFVGPETIGCMTYLTAEIIKNTKLPVGISVLWNDYKVALAIAKVCGAKFIRVPVFVDNVRTNYGNIFGNPEGVLSFRKRIGANNVLLFTDIHVKHSVLLSKNSLEESALQAIREGSDALIITGKWTGDAPDINKLKRVREVVSDFPILVGSGATKDNISQLMKYADGVIVGTSLKSGKRQNKNVNIKKYDEVIDIKKVKEFTKAFRKATTSTL